MKIQETTLPGVLLLTPQIFHDSRGAFLETYNHRRMAEAGLPTVWLQDNFSLSKKNVLRGLHYQITQPQGKLVRVVHGAVLDVAVELTAESGSMLWIPPGFGHGFLALTEDVGFAYKVTDYYAPAAERTVVWNDPDLAIAWPIAADQAIVSEKDRAGSLLKDSELFD